ncbi:NAD(P)H-binding protein [Dactylosporangium sp. NPDC005555]|uniref:NAD(P)-dependent oxidoreductase n=1 Tax=Dactylosporangium sp. NPDC005555 TaxID=3154889 RepID=UPI0033B6B056
MRLTVFGATGPTGRRLVDQAVEAGHEVTAVTRHPIPTGSAGFSAVSAGSSAVSAGSGVDPSGPGVAARRAGLTFVTGDVLDPDAVDRAVAGSDAVLSSLGVPPTRRPVSVYSRGAANIVAAMHRHGVKRLVAVSSSVMDPAWRPTGEHFFNLVMDPLVNRRVARTAHDDMRRMEALVRASDLDWTLARPSGLFDHPAVTRFQTAPDVADGLFTARPDLAAAMLAQLDDDRFVRRAMAVITTDVRPGIARLIWQEARRSRGPAGA